MNAYEIGELIAYDDSDVNRAIEAMLTIARASERKRCATLIEQHVAERLVNEEDDIAIALMKCAREIRKL